MNFKKKEDPLKRSIFVFLAVVCILQAQGVRTIHIRKGEGVLGALVRVGCSPSQLDNVLKQNNILASCANSLPAGYPIRVRVGCEAQVQRPKLVLKPKLRPKGKNAWWSLLPVLPLVLLLLLLAWLFNARKEQDIKKLRLGRRTFDFVRVTPAAYRCPVCLKDIPADALSEHLLKGHPELRSSGKVDTAL